MRVWILLAVVCSVLLAGCSSDDDAEPDPQPTASVIDSPESPSPTASSLDVCDLVGEDVLESVATDDATPRTVLGYGTENFVMCSVDSYVRFQFGFQITPGGSGLPEVTETTTTVEGLGDASVQEVAGYGGSTLWTQQDGILFVVRNETGNDGIPVEQNEVVMRDLLENVTQEVVDQVVPIELGEHCPAADDPVVTDVAGRVVTARGGEVYDGSPADCQYLGQGGTRINLGYVAQSEAAKDFVTPSGETEHEVDMEDAQRAVVGNSSPGTVNLDWATGPDLAWLADVTPLVDFPDYESGSGLATVDNVMELGRAYMELNPDAEDG